MTFAQKGMIWNTEASQFPGPAIGLALAIFGLLGSLLRLFQRRPYIIHSNIGTFPKVMQRESNRRWHGLERARRRRVQNGGQRKIDADPQFVLTEHLINVLLITDLDVGASVGLHIAR